MKRSRSSYEALSPRSTEYHTQDHNTEQHCVPQSPANIYTECFEDALTSIGDLDPLQQFLGSHVVPYGQANVSNQSDLVSTSHDAQRNHSHAQQHSAQVQQSPFQYRDDVLRGAANSIERLGSLRASRETISAHPQFLDHPAAPPYKLRRRSYSSTSQRSAVTPMSNPPVVTAYPAEARSTSYLPYRGLFDDSSAAREHRHFSTRFGRHPHIDPAEDATIKEVEDARKHHVGRIYDAMISGDRAQDNAGSIAVKRWVTGAHYKSDLVEAFAHKILDCLLVQVKEGFRGWGHNDYAEDDRKAVADDKEIDCMGRLDNIIEALEREKTICEDVVNSACQIRMFVNAPIAYAARKEQNRIGNSKRGRTRGTDDPNPRPTRRCRTGGRRTRARSTTASEVPPSRDTTPHFQSLDDITSPYYPTRTSQQSPTGPTPAYLAPRQPFQRSVASMPQVPIGCREATATAPPVMTRPTMSSSALSRSAMSPPNLPASHPFNSNVTTILPAQMSPLPSTPSLAYSYHSAPPSPDDVKYPVSANSPDDWPNTGALDNTLCTPIDPSLASNDLLFPQQVWADTLTPTQAVDSPHCFDQHQSTEHVSLSDVEYISPRALDGNLVDSADFESFWNEQPGVQPFSFHHPSNQGYDQH